jgi:hypothetical protein
VRFLRGDIEQPCNNSDNAIKLVTSCEQLGPNLFQQQCEHNSSTACEQGLQHLVCRSVTTCACLRVCTCKNAQVATRLLSSRYQDVFALLVPSWRDKSGTSCYHLVTRLMTVTDLLQVVPRVKFWSEWNFEWNFDRDKSGQKFHHSLKEHHKISNIPKFRCEML